MSPIENQLGDGFEPMTWPEGFVIYVLFLNNTIVYIGQSNNIIGRLAYHRSKGMDFDKVLVRGMLGRDEAMREEHRLIRQFEPEHNKQGIIGKVKRWTEADDQALAEVRQVMRQAMPAMPAKSNGIVRRI